MKDFPLPWRLDAIIPINGEKLSRIVDAMDKCVIPVVENSIGEFIVKSANNVTNRSTFVEILDNVKIYKDDKTNRRYVQVSSIFEHNENDKVTAIYAISLKSYSVLVSMIYHMLNSWTTIGIKRLSLKKYSELTNEKELSLIRKTYFTSIRSNINNLFSRIIK